jgi:glycosyltransferase involved in cell wall biosynthesis
VPDLARQLEELIDHPQKVERYRSLAQERAKEYSWEAVASAYEELLHDVGNGRGAQRLTATAAARV